jgi:hypothetical protein
MITVYWNQLTSGRSWNAFKAPIRDSKGVLYECGDCTLNFHAYTERKDKRDQYSTDAASGFLFGVGSVGKYLSAYNGSKTFLSRDAGQSWNEIADSPYMYEISDSGSVLVLANDAAPSETLRYYI